jgi:hypothetical protein
MDSASIAAHVTTASAHPLTTLQLDVDVEMLLSRWRAVANEKARAHATSYFKYRVLAGVTAGASIVLSTVSGISTIVVTAALVDPTMTVAIVSGCVSLVAGSLVALSRSFGLEEKAHLHNQFGGQYCEIANDIDREEALRGVGAQSFASVAELVKNVNDRLDRLDLGAPPLSC